MIPPTEGAVPEDRGPRAREAERWEARWPPDRARKFRQAAFVYLHVGLLYEMAVVVFWRQGLLPTAFGPPWLWLALGAVVVGLVVWGLWGWQNVWVARVVWAIHGLRLPALMERAFFPDPDLTIPTSFYLVAIVVVLVNLWMLARAGWDL